VHPNALSELVGENDERLCGRETIQDLDTFAGRSPEGASKIIRRLDRDAALKNRRCRTSFLVPGSPDASAASGIGSPSVCAWSSVSRSQQHRLGRRG
jgi:hypothetical protein